MSVQWDLSSDDKSMADKESSDDKMIERIPTVNEVIDSIEHDFIQLVSNGERENDPPAFWESIVQKFITDKKTASNFKQKRYD